MTTAQIIQQRLINQQIAATAFTQPEEIVQWLGAIQSQEYAMAKWAIGLRLGDISDTDAEQAFNDGKILRTHVMRPTWHFVCPEDIRWLLQLTAPRVHAYSAYYYRKMELDNNTFKRSNKLLTKTLQGDNYATRDQLRAAFTKAKINTDEMRLPYMLMYAELEGIICSGPRHGKQFTYALLDERVPPAKKLTKAEALHELAHRYFSSRAPATLQDFVWWSGLTSKDAAKGITMLGKQFGHVNIDSKTYIYKPTETIRISKARSTFLLPDYDEYGISYKDRTAIFKKANAAQKGKAANLIFSHMIVVDGVVAGTWQKTIVNKQPKIETTMFNTLNKTQQAAVKNAIKKYLSFIQE